MLESERWKRATLRAPIQVSSASAFPVLTLNTLLEPILDQQNAELFDFEY